MSDPVEGRASRLSSRAEAPGSPLKREKCHAQTEYRFRQECSTPPPAPGRTRSDSTRSIRTPRLPVQPLAGSAGAALRKPVLHSCPYFITKIIARTDGFLGRLPKSKRNV